MLERLPQELRSLPEGATRLRVDNQTQLALLTTVSADGATVHQRSTLLLLPRPGEVALVDGLQFALTLSVHAALPVHQLLDAMYADYYKDVVKRATGPIATAVASIQEASYEMSQSADATDAERIASLLFVKRHAAFEPSPRSQIYNRLKSTQRQWRLTFENHLILQYFIARFSRKFKIGHDFAEVRVLCCQQDQRVSFFDHGARDGARRYVLEQLPAFCNANDALLWSFESARELPPECYVQNGSEEKTPPCAVDWQSLRSEALRSENRMSLNALDFSPRALGQCRLYDYATRLQSVERDALPLSKRAMAPQSSAGLIVDGPRLERLTSRPKQQLPGLKRMAQSQLTFEGATKKPRQ